MHAPVLPSSRRPAWRKPAYRKTPCQRLRRRAPNSQKEPESLTIELGDCLVGPQDIRGALSSIWNAGRSNGRSGGLEREGEERRHAEEDECHEIIPGKFLLQKHGREDDETRSVTTSWISLSSYPEKWP